MKKITFILALIVLAAGAYLIYDANSPYHGLVTEREVSIDEDREAELMRELDSWIVEIQAAYEAGELPEASMLRDAALNAYNLGDLAQAREFYDQYFTQKDNDPAAWNAYGSILQQMEDWDLAEQAFRNAVEHMPLEEFYMDIIRIVELDDERADEVEGIYLEAIAVLGQTSSLMVNLADHYVDSGKCSQAAVHYSIAKTLVDDDSMKAQIQDSIDQISETCVEE